MLVFIKVYFLSNVVLVNADERLDTTAAVQENLLLDFVRNGNDVLLRGIQLKICDKTCRKIFWLVVRVANIPLEGVLKLSEVKCDVH